MPEPGPELLRLVRVAYGTLLLGTLLYTCPHARRFFVSDRWRGYARSSREVDLVQNPVALVVVQVVWMGVAVLLIVGWCAPAWLSPTCCCAGTSSSACAGRASCGAWGRPGS